MVSVPIELEQEQVEQLRERAQQLGLSLQEYMERLVRRELETREERLARVTKQVLDKNHELYKRLS